MNRDIRWKQRLNNYVQALALLERVSEDVTIADERGTLASIQAFEEVIELGWNVLKDYMEEQGLSFEPSPKGTLRQAFKSGYLQDGQVWLDALKQRNLTSHTYKQDVAETLLHNIQHRFIPAFDALKQTLLRLDSSHQA